MVSNSRRRLMSLQSLAFIINRSIAPMLPVFVPEFRKYPDPSLTSSCSDSRRRFHRHRMMGTVLMTISCCCLLALGWKSSRDFSIFRHRQSNLSSLSSTSPSLPSSRRRLEETSVADTCERLWSRDRRVAVVSIPNALSENRGSAIIDQAEQSDAWQLSRDEGHEFIDVQSISSSTFFINNFLHQSIMPVIAQTYDVPHSMGVARAVVVRVDHKAGVRLTDYISQGEFTAVLPLSFLDSTARMSNMSFDSAVQSFEYRSDRTVSKSKSMLTSKKGANGAASLLSWAKSRWPLRCENCGATLIDSYTVPVPLGEVLVFPSKCILRRELERSRHSNLMGVSSFLVAEISVGQHNGCKNYFSSMYDASVDGANRDDELDTSYLALHRTEWSSEDGEPVTLSLGAEQGTCSLANTDVVSSTDAMNANFDVKDESAFTCTDPNW